jgi:hypothetical protein
MLKEVLCARPERWMPSRHSSPHLVGHITEADTLHGYLFLGHEVSSTCQ